MEAIHNVNNATRIYAALANQAILVSIQQQQAAVDDQIKEPGKRDKIDARA